MRKFARFSLLCTWGALAGCTGTLSDEDSSDSTDSGTEPGSELVVPEELDDPYIGPTTFSCDEALSADSPALRRLTKQQYENSLHDLMTLVLGDATRSTELMAALAPVLSRIPEDERAKVPEDLHGSFRRLDQAVQQSHVDFWYEAGVEAGVLASADLNSLVGECAVDAQTDNDEQCILDFVQRVGRLALRRPLSEGELAHYRSFYGADSAIDARAFADVLGGFLNAPQFLYVVEHGGDPTSSPANTFALEAYELASRLSYHFWNSMPDERLFELADSGELLNDATYEAEVERLWADDRTRTTLHGFFREWMKLEDIPELDRNNAATVYQSFAGEDLPSATLRQEMADEVVDLIDYFTWTQPGGIEQLLLTPHSFARTPELAALYGITAWDGEGEPPSLGDERPGFLTRAAFLATGTANTRPIMKGLFIRTNVLCDKIPPPPENASAEPPELDPVLSTREVVEELTESDVGCSSCHARFINPLGFATENFDSLGRSRDEQQLFDDEGLLSGTAAIDTQTTPQILQDDDSVSEGPADLMGMIADSGKATSCAVRHYFRFSMGRWEGVVSDGCLLESMRVALEETGSLAGMLRSVALSDAFRRRTFLPADAVAGGQN